jgi:hypothetical protein
MTTPDNQSQPQMAPKIGDRVRLLADIWDDGQDHHPPGYLAHKGEVLIVRSVTPGHWPIYISHEQITDGSLGVELSEIEVVHD